MRNLNIEFEEKEFKTILKVKEISKLSWKNFILDLIVYNQDRFLKNER